ncbi:MAG: DMT family transporter [Pirellulales bacterium]|nr:DMT family transporter [Pirellulales bacterium]
MGKFRDWGLLLLCNFFWACQPTLVNLVQNEMGPLFATFFPISIATLLLIPIVARERRGCSAPPSRMTRADLRDFILLGIFGQVAAQLLITWGTAPKWSPAANTSLLFLALPICTCVMAYFILGERMTPLRFFSFALAIAGVAMCSSKDLKGLSLSSGKMFWGSILVFLSVNGSAFYNVYCKKVLERYSPLQVMLYSYYVLLIFMFPITLAFEPKGFLDLPHYSLKAWCGLLFLAVFVYALAMVIFLNVLTRLDATQAGLSNYLLTFFGVPIAAVVLKERLTLPMILGGLLVLGSTLLITVYEEYQNKRSESLKEESHE